MHDTLKISGNARVKLTVGARPRIGTIDTSFFRAFFFFFFFIRDHLIIFNNNNNNSGTYSCQVNNEEAIESTNCFLQEQDVAASSICDCRVPSHVDPRVLPTWCGPYNVWQVRQYPHVGEPYHSISEPWRFQFQDLCLLLRLLLPKIPFLYP